MDTSPNRARTLGEELGDILRRHFPDSTCTFTQTIPPRSAQFAPWPNWVRPEIRGYLEEKGINRLFSHQAATAELAHAGTDVIVATGTSSGKSLGYQLPIMSQLAADPLACALYLTPTKALGSDQLLSFMQMCTSIPGLGSLHPAPYDGDTPPEARAEIRNSSRVVFSNPDMVHASLLGGHRRWGRFLRNLRFIVIDECHSYRGVFGAHVALVLRRLLRIASHYGSCPTIIAASATSADPAGHALRLSGRQCVLVDEDGAPTGARTVTLWEPALIDGAAGENGAPIRRAATSEAANMMSRLIAEGARTLTFVRSRRAAETVALQAAENLSAIGRQDLARRVAAYRAGYLAEDRRQLEKDLDEGVLLGVASTNALELGIDVGGLDAVVVAGFPGTVASFWQQAGRAGRRGQASLIALVARDEPMDTYLVHHPQALLERPLEATVFNPHNPYVLREHLYCAALEAPLTFAEVESFGAEEVVEQLSAQGLLRRRQRGWFPAPLPEGDQAHQRVNIRGGSGEEIMIVDSTTGRLLGTVDSARAPAQVHPGAVYLHQGEYFLIDELHLDNYLALAHPEVPDYTTYARSTTDIRILEQASPEHLVNYSPGLWVANVEVEVVDQVVGYMVKLADGTTADMIALDMPAQRLHTRAVAYTIDPLALSAMGVNAGDVPGTLHAAEHAAIALLPLIATCDRWDIGGVSTALHADTGLPTVFVYDGHPGGAGFADEGFRRFPEWIEATFEAVRACSCENGCPSCVQSPKCGNGNNPLDKAGALKLLGALVTMCAASSAGSAS